MVSLEEVQQMIVEECDSVKALLLKKNKNYGNSAVDPKRIFSKQNAVEQIKVRIDDKLSRIQNMGFSANNKLANEDACQDLIGYLILLRIAERIHKDNQQ